MHTGLGRLNGQNTDDHQICIVDVSISPDNAQEQPLRQVPSFSKLHPVPGNRATITAEWVRGKD